MGSNIDFYLMGRKVMRRDTLTSMLLGNRRLASWKVEQIRLIFGTRLPGQ